MSATANTKKKKKKKSGEVLDSKFNTHTKMVVYIACLLTTLLYGSESWTTLGKEKEKALRILHVQPATPPGYHDTPWVSRHPLGITTPPGYHVE